MSKPITITWPDLDNDGVCSLQTRGSAGNLVINGALSSPLPYGVGNQVVFTGFSRNITVASTANNSGISITITGTYLGQPQTEVLAGPNNNTVTGSELFDSVISVSISGATTGGGLIVGIGTTGMTNWISYNYHASVAALTILTFVEGTINYTFQFTLEDVNTSSNPIVGNGVPVPDTTGPNAFRLAMVNETTGDTAFANFPVSFYRIKFNSGSGSLITSFVQQGIT
jgi:hypothetical protein